MATPRTGLATLNEAPVAARAAAGSLRPGPGSGHGDELFVGIDLGTSGCRALAIDRPGRIVAASSSPLPAPPRHGTACEQDPEIWRQALFSTLAGLLDRTDRSRVRAMAVDGTSASVLLTDLAGEPLGPALMYNDARALAEAARIAEIAPPQSPARGPSSGLAKVLWLLEHGPRRRARHALQQADWLSGLLCGRFGLSDENHALKMGYDPVLRRWPEWMRGLGLEPAVLPRVVPPGSVLGRLGSVSRRRLSLPADTLVVAGTTDSTAAFLATGARQPGEAVTCLGSTLVLKILGRAPVFSAPHGVYSHRLGDLWLCGGASNTGGATLLRYFGPGELAAMTPRLRPEEPTGLDYYPLPGPGERFPIADPTLPPRLSPRPEDDLRFFQGILEGIARIEAQGYRLLTELGAPRPLSVRSTGGGAHNRAWSLLRARELGIPLLEAEQSEAAYGTALLARHGVRSARGEASGSFPGNLAAEWA
jgi:sugar (pentulose or hexulose) kinase